MTINEDNPWELKQWTSLFDGTHTFREPMNVNTIKRIVASEYDHPYEREEDNGVFVSVYEGVKTHLKKLLTSMKNGIMVNKPHIHKTKQFGRAIYPKSLTLGALPRGVRHTIAGEDWVDIDMDNAHPTILLQLCEYYCREFDDEDFNEGRFVNLKKYCVEREAQLERLVKNYFQVEKTDPIYKKCRDKVKTLVLRTFFLGSQRKWKKEHSIADSIPDDDFLTGIKNEISSLTTDFIIPQNPELYKKVQAEIRKKKTEALKAGKPYFKNEKASICSLFLQHYERVLLETAVIDLIDRDIIENLEVAYCYDGFMIRKTAFEKFTKAYDIPITDHIQAVLRSKTLFNMKWSVKAMDEHIWDHIHAYEQSLNKTFAHPCDKIDIFDWNYFNNECDSYSMKKDYFELFVSSVKKDNTYYIIENEYHTNFYSNTQYKQRAITSYDDIGLKKRFRECGSGEYSQKGKEEKFIDKWLDDSSKRMYQTINFYPQNFPFHKLNNNPYTLNTFTGYNPILWDTEYDKSRRLDILFPFFAIGSNVFGSTEDFNVFLHLMAHVIKYPTRKLPYSVVLKGVEGEGKNVILSVFASIIGEEHYLTTSNIDDILGTHAEGINHKLIVNLNEMGLASTNKHTNRLKSVITEDTIVVNAKFKAPTIQDNFAFIVITSNETIPVRIDIVSKDRRYFVFQGNGENVKTVGEEDWSRYIKHFKNHKFITALYDYLMDLDIENYNFKEAKYENSLKRPYKNIASHFVPMEALFLNDMILEKTLWTDHGCMLDTEDIHEENYTPFHKDPDFFKKTTIQSKQLIQMFRSWATENKFKQASEEKNSKAFNNKIVNMGFKSIEKKADITNHICFVFVPADLYIELHERKFTEINTSLDWYIDYKSRTALPKPTKKQSATLIPYELD